MSVGTYSPLPSAFCRLLFSNSPFPCETTATSKLAVYTLANPNLVALVTNLNKQLIPVSL